MPTYTLKSNATTAAAIVGFVSDNGLFNLIDGAAVAVVGPQAGTATGADAISTYAGHPAYGDAAATGNYLTANASLGIMAGEKFAVLQLGHFGSNANDETFHVDAPGGLFRFGTKFNSTTGAKQNTIVPGWGALAGGDLSAAGYAHPDARVFKLIWGRESTGAIRTYVNEFGTTSATTNATITGALIGIGTWEFGGAVAGNIKVGIQICIVFKGVSPEELTTYLGADPYAALFDTVAGAQVVFTGPVPAQTGVVGTASTALALAPYFSAGTAPYTYSIQAGLLPPGLNLNTSTGAITGTPTSAGSYAATARATDSTSPTPTTANTNSIGWTISQSAATATTMTAGSSGGQVGVASALFTVGANGAITGTVTVTLSDNAGGGTFSVASVAISAASPTATFTYTPASTGAKTISSTNSGGLTNAAPLTYTATATAGTVTSSVLKNNTGTLLASTACEAFLNNPTTGVLAVKKTAITTNASGVVSFSDGAVVPGTSYRVVWRMTGDGAEGLETLTAT